jgi:hypothetical protein
MPLERKLFADPRTSSRTYLVQTPVIWMLKPQIFSSIVNVNTEEGWVVPDDAEAMWQVDARLLFVPPTDPPRFPDNDLFLFERVESD